jgi:saccharopine dehydrogenase-like NADP-dependent oxidoreductase
MRALVIGAGRVGSAIVSALAGERLNGWTWS